MHQGMLRRWRIGVIALFLALLLAPLTALAVQEGTVSTSALVMRASANKGSAALQTLRRGETVYITGSSGEWYRVTYGKYKGYVLKSYVSVGKGSASASRSSSSSSSGSSSSSRGRRRPGAGRALSVPLVVTPPPPPPGAVPYDVERFGFRFSAKEHALLAFLDRVDALSPYAAVSGLTIEKLGPDAVFPADETRREPSPSPCPAARPSAGTTPPWSSIFP